jgi:acetyltransferase
MVDEIEAAPLLRGARGRTPADEDEIIETIQRLSQLVTDFPAILELDINPLVAGADGVEAVDLRLTVDTDQL